MAVRKKSHFKYILAIDCETTGVCIRNNDPLLNTETGERHQAISWGIIVADADTLEPVEELYLEIKWNEESKRQRAERPKFGKYAEGIHGLTFEYLEENGIDEEEAVTQIVNLIVKFWGTTRPLNLLAHNVAFDRRHLSDLFDRFKLDLTFSSRHVDSFAIGFTNWRCYDSDELFALVCEAERKDHNALEDIQLTLESVRTTRKLFEAMLDADK